MTAHPMPNRTPPPPRATGASRVRCPKLSPFTAVFWTPGRTFLGLAGVFSLGMMLVDLAEHFDPLDRPLVGGIPSSIRVALWGIAGVAAIMASLACSPRWRGRLTRTAWGLLVAMPGVRGIDGLLTIVEAVMPGPPDPSALVGAGRALGVAGAAAAAACLAAARSSMQQSSLPA